MPRVHEPKLHLFNYSRGKSLCGRQVERYGPQVTSDCLDVTCEVCQVERQRMVRQLQELHETLHPKVLVLVLEDAGVLVGASHS
jgi:short-subunit dehydrogenase involved in D-alanine esterification of teichoic acids